MRGTDSRKVKTGVLARRVKQVTAGAQTRVVAVEMVRSGWILSVLKVESEFAGSLDVVGGGKKGRVKVISRYLPEQLEGQSGHHLRWGQWGQQGWG